MGSGPSRTSYQESRPVDLRSDAEKRRDELAAQKHLEFLNQEDLGYDMLGDDPYQRLREKEEGRFKEGVMGTAADLGFAQKGFGPGLSVIGKGLADISARETARRGDEYQRWKQFILSGGRASQSAAGYGQRTYGETRERQGSPWARAAGGLGGAVIGRVNPFGVFG